MTHLQRGTILVPVVVFAMTVMALTASIMTSGVAVQRQTRAHVATQEAQQAAESGIHAVVARLSGMERGALLASGRVEETLRGTGEAAARYAVSLQPGGNDLADNDGDGETDEPDEADIVEVVSTGSYDGAWRTVYVTLLARYRSPGVGAAIYVSNPAADLDLDGKSLLISGRDVDLKQAETGALVPGVGVNGDPSLLRNQVRSLEGARVVGEGPSPSVLEVPPLDLQALIEEGARSANVVLEAGEVNKVPGPGAWGTLEHPAVLYSSGSVKISGGSSGAGVLLVNGDLEITGEFEWWGLVIVQGRVVMKGGGGGKRVVGALVVEDDVANGLDQPGVRAAGTVDILFSREAVRTIGRVLSRYTILNWREGPTPESEKTR